MLCTEWGAFSKQLEGTHNGKLLLRDCGRNSSPVECALTDAASACSGFLCTCFSLKALDLGREGM